MTTPSKMARVEQKAANMLPILAVGEISPEVLLAWEMGCRQFLMHKNVPDTEMVRKVAWGMRDPMIQTWYLDNHNRFNKLSFAEYMKEVRSYWLPSNWDFTVRRKMWSSMQGQRPFNEWAFEIQSLNNLLQDTPSHLTDTDLRRHLEARMHSDLVDKYYAEKIIETDLRKWIEMVGLLDDQRLLDIERFKELHEAVWRAERRKITTSKKSASSARSKPKAGRNMSTTSISSSSRPFTRLPRLTDDERQLLRDNEGCFKCREPFVQHSSNNCPEGFPNGATYTPLTAASISAKKSPMPSAVLGYESDSSEEYVAPFTTLHLTWDCPVDSPVISSSVVVSALIDRGPPTVLIDEAKLSNLASATARYPSLSHVQLHCPVTRNGFSPSCITLNLYTHLALYAQFTAPNLCTFLLSGIGFCM
ncbi:hypothetical protein EDD22DRAFT_894206 [Suillus occidentalis]|nr:hypothetical protein EDD22DRAFT_894206 [Suillus occidentalis]